MREHDWSRDLRFILDRIDEIPDPIDRLNYLKVVRAEMAEVLTAAYERACFDARYAEREDEAIATGLTKTQVRAYSRRWNGRFEGSRRVRWEDPLGVHRRQHLMDLTEVAKGNTPDAIRRGWRQTHPNTPQ